MKLHNLTNYTKPILVISLILVSAIAIGTIIPTIYADHGEDGVTKTLNASNEVSFRDISNLSDGDIVLSSDTTTSSELTFTVTDPDANLNSAGIEVILSSVTSTTSVDNETEFSLTETSADSGTFVD